MYFYAFIQSDLKDAISQLKLFNRTVIRYFNNNANALLKLRHHAAAPALIISQFELRLQEVKLLMFERLRTTVEEESEKQDKISLIVAKELKTSTEVKALKEELEKAKRERNLEISKKNEIIRKLKGISYSIT
jgi:hypothetical protein